MAHGTSIGLVGSCLAFLAGSVALAQSSSSIDERIRAGVAQYDRGDLASARAIFEGVIEEAPDHVTAIYELAYTHLGQGDAARSLEILDEAIARPLPVTAEFYALSASILDNIGRPEEAVERFDQGVAAFPDNHNLVLNFGITQLRLNDRESARSTFERAATLAPDHPSAHFFLGQIYAGEGRTAAAVLALGKGIGFDNQGQRIASSTMMIKSMMENGVQTSEDGTPIVVVDVNYLAPPMTIDKLSSAVPLRYSMALAAQRKSGGDLSYEPYAVAFATLVSEFVDADIDPESHFAAAHYRDFFGPMAENGHVLTFAHMILAALNPQGATAWIESHREEVDAFRAWTRSRQVQGAAN